MTAIGAISDGRNIWIAGDSFCGDEIVKNTCKSTKVYKVGPVGVGLCGFVRQELILENILRKNIEIDKITITHDWIKFILPDLLEETMRTKHATIDKNSQSTLGESSYLIAFDGKIYYLEDDFGIWESRSEFAAIGIGNNMFSAPFKQ